MVMGLYIPDRKDIVWLDFNPQLGHEQRGRRPALVVSHEEYNQKTGMAIFCPITSKIKGYPFEVIVHGSRIDGCVLSDQLKSLDWTVRNIEFIAKLSSKAFEEMLTKIKVIID